MRGSIQTWARMIDDLTVVSELAVVLNSPELVCLTFRMLGHYIVMGFSR